MQTYIFHRTGVFYPVDLADGEDAIRNAENNPGTTMVTGTGGAVIWRKEGV